MSIIQIYFQNHFNPFFATLAQNLNTDYRYTDQTLEGSN